MEPWQAVLGLVLIWVANYTVTHMGNIHYAKQCTNMDVFDLGFTLTPHIRIPDAVIHLYTLGLWIPFIVMLPRSTLLTVVDDVAFPFLVLMLVRALTIMATVFPKSDRECDTTTFHWGTLIGGGCYDKVFSGHALGATLISLSLVRHGVWPAWGGWAYVVGASLLQLLSRGHYTVDIILGCVLAWMGFKLRIQGA